MSLLSCIPTFLTGQDSNQDEIDDALYNQLEYLQEEVTKPLDVIEGEFDDQKDNLQLECRVSAIQKETVIILGKRPVVHRIFVEGEHSSNYGVGWILYNDIDNCLICAKPFNNRNLKRYCWACGNLVCHKCSPSAREVHGIKELGKKRVCNQCNYGQETIYASMNLKPTRDLDSSSRDSSNTTRESISSVNAGSNSNLTTMNNNMDNNIEASTYTTSSRNNNSPNERNVPVRTYESDFIPEPKRNEESRTNAIPIPEPTASNQNSKPSSYVDESPHYESSNGELPVISEDNEIFAPPEQDEMYLASAKAAESPRSFFSFSSSSFATASSAKSTSSRGSAKQVNPATATTAATFEKIYQAKMTGNPMDAKGLGRKPSQSMKLSADNLNARDAAQSVSPPAEEKRGLYRTNTATSTISTDSNKSLSRNKSLYERHCDELQVEDIVEFKTLRRRTTPVSSPQASSSPRMSRKSSKQRVSSLTHFRNMQDEIEEDLLEQERTEQEQQAKKEKSMKRASDSGRSESGESSGGFFGFF